jgi:hypothetical protein
LSIRRLKTRANVRRNARVFDYTRPRGTFQANFAANEKKREKTGPTRPIDKRDRRFFKPRKEKRRRVNVQKRAFFRLLRRAAGGVFPYFSNNDKTIKR